MARFYSNENFPFPVVVALRLAGHDVLTSRDAGRANRKIPDDQVLAYAIQEKRAVLTLNRRDFMRLHRQSDNHAGIVVCTSDSDYDRQAARIVAEVAGVGSLERKLVRVNRPRV
jgi:predicted nuclease of predicted toxin-antitoxin system